MLLLKISRLPYVDLSACLSQLSNAMVSWVLWQSCINQICFLLLFMYIVFQNDPCFLCSFFLHNSILNEDLLWSTQAYFCRISLDLTENVSFSLLQHVHFLAHRVTCAYLLLRGFCDFKAFRSLGDIFLDHVATYLGARRCQLA